MVTNQATEKRVGLAKEGRDKYCMRRRTYTPENDANKLRCTFAYLWQEMTTSTIPMLYAKTRRKQERKRPKENERKVTATNENETNVCSGRRACPEWTRLLLAGTISFTLRPVDGPTEDRKKCRNEIKNGKRADTEPKLKIQARLMFCHEEIGINSISNLANDVKPCILCR